MVPLNLKFKLRAEDGWTPLDKGVINKQRLINWIKEYFNANEELSNFFRRNNGEGLELMSEDESRGYVFVGSLQLDRNYEASMMQIRNFYFGKGKTIIKSFTDFQQECAGFSWRSA